MPYAMAVVKRPEHRQPDGQQRRTTGYAFPDVERDPTGTYMCRRGRPSGRSGRWAQYLDGQRVHSRLQFRCQFRHDGAVLCNPVHPRELLAGDADPEMGFAALAPAGVPPMFLALVCDFKMAGSKFQGKFLNNRIANGHKDYRFECWCT